MSDLSAAPDAFDAPAAEPAVEERVFVVDIDGFEGPLDLLLDLARRQKVDLAKISISALAEQYLGFIEEARRLRLELAADYLVMAAWLAYLKSRLLLPSAPRDEEPSGEALAAALAHRLRRLEAMRNAAQLLMDRPQLGRDVFSRGSPEGVRTDRQSIWEATLYELLTAYARQRQVQALSHVTIRRRPVWPLAEARAALERLVGRISDWTSLDELLFAYLAAPQERRTVAASSFAASLELVREGSLDIRQDRAFAPIWVKPIPPEERRRPEPEAAP